MRTPGHAASRVPRPRTVIRGTIRSGPKPSDSRRIRRVATPCRMAAAHRSWLLRDVADAHRAFVETAGGPPDGLPGVGFQRRDARRGPERNGRQPARPTGRKRPYG